MDSQSGTHGSGREIRRESSDNSSLVSMSLADLTPNGSEFASLFLVMGLVDIDDSLSEVVLGVLGSVNILKSEDGLLGSLVLSVSSEAEELRLNPESDWGLVVFAGFLRSLDFDHWFIIFLFLSFFD